MGDIADMLLDGTLDYHTGEYMGTGSGFPRSIHGEPRSFNPLWGIENYFHNYRGIKNAAEVHKIMRQWAVDQNLSITKKKEMTKIAFEIQKDFKAFKEWYNTRYEK